MVLGLSSRMQNFEHPRHEVPRGCFEKDPEQQSVGLNLGRYLRLGTYPSDPSASQPQGHAYLSHRERNGSIPRQKPTRPPGRRPAVIDGNICRLYSVPTSGGGGTSLRHRAHCSGTLPPAPGGPHPVPPCVYLLLVVGLRCLCRARGIGAPAGPGLVFRGLQQSPESHVSLHGGNRIPGVRRGPGRR